MDYRTLFGLLALAFVGACGAYVETDMKGECRGDTTIVYSIPNGASSI